MKGSIHVYKVKKRKNYTVPYRLSGASSMVENVYKIVSYLTHIIVGMPKTIY